MNKKTIYIITITMLVTAVLGISYAYFQLVINGNEDAKVNKVVSGSLILSFKDENEIGLDNAFPGDSFLKEISVTNEGTLDTKYNLVWQDLTNEFINDELVIEATCERLNSSNTVEGTCNDIDEIAINNSIIKSNISIESGITHKYTVRVTFKDTGSNQDYNKNKTFSGKFGVNEYVEANFNTDSWSKIIFNVKSGNTFDYNVGDTKEVDMGTLGVHTVRIGNKSTPEECKQDGFSETACGFVLEFQDVVFRHLMNPKGEYNGTSYIYGYNKGGWPASQMRTYVNTDIYNALPDDLKSGIIDTRVVSGYGKEDSDNFVSTDKLYLLSSSEIWAQGTSTNNYDTAKDLTRQLDYYSNLGVTVDNNYNNVIKKSGATAWAWWTRTAYSTSNNYFVASKDSGYRYYYSSDGTFAVSPAFRIG